MFSSSKPSWILKYNFNCNPKNIISKTSIIYKKNKIMSQIREVCLNAI